MMNNELIKGFIDEHCGVEESEYGREELEKMLIGIFLQAIEMMDEGELGHLKMRDLGMLRLSSYRVMAFYNHMKGNGGGLEYGKEYYDRGVKILEDVIDRDGLREKYNNVRKRSYAKQS